MSGITMNPTLIWEVPLSSISTTECCQIERALELASMVGRVMTLEISFKSIPKDVMYLIIKALLGRDHLITDRDDVVIDLTLVCKEWTRPVREALSMLGWKREKMVSLSATIFWKVINHVDWVVVSDVESDQEVMSLRRTDARLSVKSNTIINDCNVKRRTITNRVDSCIASEEASIFEHASRCLFALLVKKESERKFKVESKWWYKGVLLQTYNEEGGAKTVARENVKADVLVNEILLAIAKFKGLKTRKHRSVMKGKFVATPYTIFKWIESIWNSNGKVPEILKKIADQFDEPTSFSFDNQPNLSPLEIQHQSTNLLRRSCWKEL